MSLKKSGSFPNLRSELFLQVAPFGRRPVRRGRTSPEIEDVAPGAATGIEDVDPKQNYESKFPKTEDPNSL